MHKQKRGMKIITCFRTFDCRLVGKNIFRRKLPLVVMSEEDVMLRRSKVKLGKGQKKVWIFSHKIVYFVTLPQYIQISTFRGQDWSDSFHYCLCFRYPYGHIRSLFIWIKLICWLSSFHFWSCFTSICIKYIK